MANTTLVELPWTMASSELSATQEWGTKVTTCTEECRELVAETSRGAVTASREEVARARDASSPSSPS